MASRKDVKSLAPRGRLLQRNRMDIKQAQKANADKARNKARAGLEQLQDDDDILSMNNSNVGSQQQKRSDDRACSSTSKGGNDRLTRLREFQQRRAEQKQKDKQHQKPAFRVGVYKLDSTFVSDKFTNQAKNRSQNEKMQQRVKTAGTKRPLKQVAKVTKPATRPLGRASKSKFGTATITTKELQLKQRDSARKKLFVDRKPQSKNTPKDSASASVLATPLEEIVKATTTTKSAAVPQETKRSRKSVRIANVEDIALIDNEASSSLNKPKKTRRSFRVAALLMPEPAQESTGSLPVPFSESSEIQVVATPRRSARLASRNDASPHATPSYANSCSRASKKKKRFQKKLKGTPHPMNRTADPDQEVEDDENAAEEKEDLGKYIGTENSSSLTPFLNAMSVTDSVKKSEESSSTTYEFQPIEKFGQFKFADTNTSIEFSAVPSNDPFKTPTLTMSARAKRYHRRSKITDIRDLSQSGVQAARGSSSSRRRQKKGQDPFTSLFEEDFFSETESPLHSIIKGKDASSGELLSSRPSIPTGNLISFNDSPDVRQTPRVLRPLNLKDSCDEPENDNKTCSDSDASEPDNAQPSSAADFRRLLDSETARLTSLCESWNEFLTSSEAESVPSELIGEIRTIIGKTNLLMNQKGRFEQFRGLIHNCEYGNGEKPTLVQDLQGFWDMIHYQVEDVDQKFEELRRLKENGWHPLSVPSILVTSPAKKSGIKKIGTAKGGVKKFEKPKKASQSLRQMIMAKRRELKENADTSSTRPVTDAKDPEERLFEGGFFAVRSPLRKITTPE